MRKSKSETFQKYFRNPARPKRCRLHALYIVYKTVYYFISKTKNKKGINRKMSDPVCIIADRHQQFFSNR